MRYPIAVFVSDIHLTLQQPSCRADKNWMEVQAHYLKQLRDIALSAPVFCSGDIFDRWNPSPELINFALKNLPDGMICVPGQHDLPNHRIDQIDRSAYGVLVEAKKIRDISGKSTGNMGGFTANGFGWGQEITPPEKLVGGMKRVAIIHRYCWFENCHYPGAPQASNISSFKDNLKGYDLAAVGDNHLSFVTSIGGCHVFNCGGFIKRKSDEIDYRPNVGILYSTGQFGRKFLDTSIDKFHDKAEQRKEVPVNMKAFIDQLEGLGEHGLNFREAVLHHLETEEIDKETRQIIMTALEQKEKT